MAEKLDFETLVANHYQPLYQFAFSLTRDEAESCDLTQQTFYIWAAKGQQLRDLSKVKPGCSRRSTGSFSARAGGKPAFPTSNWRPPNRNCRRFRPSPSTASMWSN
jgi:hypothetical protein